MSRGHSCTKRTQYRGQLASTKTDSSMIRHTFEFALGAGLLGLYSPIPDSSNYHPNANGGIFLLPTTVNTNPPIVIQQGFFSAPKPTGHDRAPTSEEWETLIRTILKQVELMYDGYQIKIQVQKFTVHTFGYTVDVVIAGSPPTKRKRTCTHSRNQTTGKCRSEKEHLRMSQGRKRRSCTYSRHQTTGKCRSQREHSSSLKRSKRAFAKRKLASLARRRAREREHEREMHGQDGYVPFV